MTQKNQVTFKELLELSEKGKRNKLFHKHWQLFRRKFNVETTFLTIILFTGPILLSVGYVWSLSSNLFFILIGSLIVTFFCGLIYARLKSGDITDLNVKSQLLGYLIMIIFAEILAITLIALGVGTLTENFWISTLWVSFFFNFNVLSLELGVYIGYCRIKGVGIVHLSAINILTLIKKFFKKNSISESKCKKLVIDEFLYLLKGLNIWCVEDYNSGIVDLEQVHKQSVTLIIDDFSTFREKFEEGFTEKFSDYLRANHKTKDLFPEVKNEITDYLSISFFEEKERFSKKFKRYLGIQSYFPLISVILAIIIPLILYFIQISYP